MPERTQNQERQATVSREGSKFEFYVKNTLNDAFTDKNQNIRILNGNEVFRDPHLKEHFTIPVRGFNKTGEMSILLQKILTPIILSH
jgi:hypothetical protein